MEAKSLFLIALVVCSLQAVMSASCSFPLNTNGTQCWGLVPAPQALSAADCRTACCANATCVAWQFCTYPAIGCPTKDAAGCWLGLGSFQDCKSVPGWEGEALLTANVDASTIPSEQWIPVMGNATSSQGTMSISSRSLYLNGSPLHPRIGEIQFSRIPAEEWYDTIVAAREGGLSTVGTYVFWIHQEEQQGVWRWDGQRNLRAFAETVARANMTLFVRAGPWAHGECRNGGFPDWLVQYPGIQLRSTQPLYMSFVKVLYQQIAAQLDGLYWHQGGPIIGMQVENEWGGSYEYLQQLKQIAIDAGVNIPFFSKTGWPDEPEPYGMLLPFSGGYADGFWGNSRVVEQSFSSSYLLTPAASRFPGYPPLTVETGGGMTVAYHRRIWMHPQDMGALTLVSFGCGNNGVGYYIYRGGTNPDGVLSTLEECQITKYPNDLQIKNYDFFAPINQFGDPHPHYHLLRRLHLFLQDYSYPVVNYFPFSPDIAVSDYTDLMSLRWSVRSDGTGGLVFINNYQRNWNMSNATSMLAAHSNIRLSISLKSASGSVRQISVPAANSPAVKIGVGSYMFWPFAFPIAPGVTLRYSTCEPITSLDYQRGQMFVVVFYSPLAEGCEMAVENSAVTLQTCNAECSTEDGAIFVRNIPSGGEIPYIMVSFKTATKVIAFVVLGQDASQGVWKGVIAGEPRLLLTQPHGQMTSLLLNSVNTSSFRVRTNAASVNISVFPPLEGLVYHGESVAPYPNGLFIRYPLDVNANVNPFISVSYQLVQAAGPARKVPIGPAGVAQAPNEDGLFGNTSDWNAAAVYKVTLYGSIPDGGRSSLRVRYWGDCARVYRNGSIVQDDFYNGDEEYGFLLGINRFSPAIFNLGFELRILPLSQDAPIYLAGWPPFAPGETSVIALLGIDVLQTSDLALGASSTSR